VKTLEFSSTAYYGEKGNWILKIQHWILKIHFVTRPKFQDFLEH